MLLVGPVRHLGSARKHEGDTNEGLRGAVEARPAQDLPHVVGAGYEVEAREEGVRDLVLLAPALAQACKHQVAVRIERLATQRRDEAGLDTRFRWAGI